MNGRNKIMKKIITSNSRSLRSALCGLLLGAAALWALPGITQAQPILYAGFGNNGIGRYNANTGAVINAELITPGEQVAFSDKIQNRGNTILVLANGPAPSPTVSQYSLTGAVINLNFITGLYFDTGIAVVGDNSSSRYIDTNTPPYNQDVATI